MAGVDPFADERAFLDAYDPGAFPRPSLAVDVVLLTVVEGALRVWLIRRLNHPFAGRWTLPGGFVGIDEDLPDAAGRVLRDKAELHGVKLEQLRAFGAPERDPRMRIVSVAFLALIDPDLASDVRGQWGDVRVPWSGIDEGPVVVFEAGEPLELGFDHATMIGAAIARLRRRLAASPLGYQLLPPAFTLRHLQQVHEAVSGRRVNKDSFRRKALASGDLQPTGDREEAVGHRPAELYTFVRGAAL